MLVNFSGYKIEDEIVVSYLPIKEKIQKSFLFDIGAKHATKGMSVYPGHVAVDGVIVDITLL